MEKVEAETSSSTLSKDMKKVEAETSSSTPPLVIHKPYPPSHSHKHILTVQRRRLNSRQIFSNMEGEIRSFITVWISVIASLCYSYFIVSKIPKGKLRFLSLLPVFFIFLTLPFLLSSVFLSGFTALFISWLATFKLALFSFDLGPLSAHPPKSLPIFIAIAFLPIKIKQNPKHLCKPPKLPLNFTVKVLGFALFVGLYDHKERLQPNIFLCLLCCQVFLFIEVVFSVCNSLGNSMAGLEVEQPSDEPYLSTSLQDFWGRRWNLMVTNLLRQAVYNPVKSASEKVVSKQLAPLLAAVATFVVSGLMHELLFYYVIRRRPTWEMTLFFVLHGLCLVVEVGFKSVMSGRWRLHWAVSGPLTMGFVVATSFWLFFPPLVRAGLIDRMVKEIRLVLELISEKIIPPINAEILKNL